MPPVGVNPYARYRLTVTLNASFKLLRLRLTVVRNGTALASPFRESRVYFRMAACLTLRKTAVTANAVMDVFKSIIP